MTSQFAGAALFLLPSLYFTGANLFSGQTNIMVALYMALIPMFLGYLCFGYGLKFIASSEATLITLLEPAVATLLAVVIVGERFAYAGWLGLIFISLCLLLQLQTTDGLSASEQKTVSV